MILFLFRFLFSLKLCAKMYFTKAKKKTTLSVDFFCNERFNQKVGFCTKKGLKPQRDFNPFIKE